MNVDVKPSPAGGDTAGGAAGDRPRRRDRRRPDGQRHRPCLRAGRPAGHAARREAGRAEARRMATIARNMDRQVNRSLISAEDRDEALARITTSHRLRGVRRRRPGDRGGDREGGRQARDLQAADAASEAVLPAGVQHVVDLDHPAGRGDRPAGKVHRHALHEPGAGHEAGGDHPRHRDRRADLPGGAGAGRRSWARSRRWPRISRRSSSTASWCR